MGKFEAQRDEALSKGHPNKWGMGDGGEVLAFPDSSLAIMKWGTQGALHRCGAGSPSLSLRELWGSWAAFLIESCILGT